MKIIKIKYFHWMLVGVLVGTTGCASWRVSHQGRGASTEGDNGEALVQISGNEKGSKDVMANIATPYRSPLGDIPLDLTPLTEKWIQYFQGKGRKHMDVYLERSSRYLPMMKNTLRENGLPEDLVYIALIESGFSPLAHSRANAVGYWQFIRSTGRRYGLMVDPFIDERRDPVLSTRAAAEYFKALYNLFGSWHLSLAAYNVGENRVKRAVMAYYTRDYWKLIQKRRAFPKETRHYVAKFIAATLIAKDPAKYGFTNIEYQSPLAFDTVHLTNPVNMAKLAQEMNVSAEDLKMLNPKFRGDYVPQYRGSETVIRVPVGMATLASAAIPKSFSDRPKVLQTADYTFYKIKRGDTLSTIARRHRTSVAQIRRLNSMNKLNLLRVGARLKVPDRGGAFVTYEMPAENENQEVADNNSPNSATSEKVEFEKDSADQQEENDDKLEDDKIASADSDSFQPLAAPASASVEQGQSDAVTRPDSVIRQVSSSEDSTKNNDKDNKDDKKDDKEVKKEKVVHIVRRGENLTVIAHKYGVSVHQLKRLNKLSSRSILRAGQTLKLKDQDEGHLDKPTAIEGSRRLKVHQRVNTQVAQSATKNLKKHEFKKQKHLIRPGETLAEIARHYQVSVGALVESNFIKNKSRLLAGRELIIP